MSHQLEAHLLAQTDQATAFFWHRLRWQFVRQHLPSTRFTLLDVGAGSGVTGAYLKRDRPDATYCFDEPIESLCEQLIRVHGADHLVGRTDSIEQVDVVTLLDVLEHIEDDHRFLSDLVRRLTPGTTIIITVPASQRYWSRWDVSLGHHRRYEPAALDALVADLPVRCIERGRLFPEMVPGAWLRARLHPDTVRKGTAGTPRDDSSEFPDLPEWINRALYYAGLPGIRWRQRMPIGTSLCQVLVVR